MLLVLVALLFSGSGAFIEDCEEYCEQNETCCPGPSSDVLCCPLVNATCCEYYEYCCPEGSFCDLDMGMCGTYFIPQLERRSGDFENEEDIATDSTQHQPEEMDIFEQLYTNETSTETDIDHMFVHCGLNQFCPYFSTCCHMKEDNVYLCCPNTEGVCCANAYRCCKQEEKCDAKGPVCLSGYGLAKSVRKADPLWYHYEKRGQSFVEPEVIKGKS